MSARLKHKFLPSYSHPKRAKTARLGAPVLARWSKRARAHGRQDNELNKKDLI